MWTTGLLTRKKLGLTEDEASESDLLDYINDAQRQMLGDISHSITDEELEGNIDGSNTTFTTDNLYIADTDFDLSVGTTDVTVYGWTNKDDPSTKASLALSTIHALYGKVVLAVAPSTSYQKITCDYNYYDSPIDSDDIADTCAYLAAFFYGLSEYALMPKQWMHGAYRFLKDMEGLSLLEERYWYNVHKITGRVSEKGEHDTPTLDRDEGTYR